MDHGVISSLLQHPLTSALLLLAPDGRPLAANAAAQAMELPRTVEAYAGLLYELRACLDDGQPMLPCTLPGSGGRRLDGWLRAVRDEQGALLAYTLSVPEPVASEGATRWEVALESSEQCLWDWDIPSDTFFRSDRGKQVLGQDDRALANGLNAMLQLVHPDDQRNVRDAVQAHFDGRTPRYASEFRIRHNDGQWRWILDRGRLVARTADGSPLRMVGTHTDIHEQKLLEQRLRDQQVMLRDAQRVTNTGSWSWDVEQDQAWWSREFLALTAPTDGQFPNSRGWLRLLSRESAAQLAGAWRRLKREGKPVNLDIELVANRASPLHLRLWAQPMLDRAGRINRVLGQVQNITEQRQTDALIRWRTELLNRVSALGRIGGCEIEVDTRRIQCTEECYRIHGLRKEPVALDRLLSLYTRDSQDAFEAALSRIAQGGLPEQLDLCFHRASGQRLWVQVLIELDNRDGLPQRFVVLFRDITRERESRERIELLAHYDALTGLPNRTLLRSQVEQAMQEAAERGSTLAMLFVDLDGFKSINDSFGHATGDALLKLAATRMHQQLRTNDLFGRFSGDEFVVVLRDLAEPEDAGHVARKLMAALAEPLDRNELVIKLGASIGIALMEDGRRDFDSLLQASDAAMHAAKESGRNACQYYSQDVLQRTQRRLEIERALRGALDRDEFSLVYQPLAHAAGGRAPAVEALLRWHRPDLGHCSPVEFIPIAEQCGEIVRLGDWVIGEACRQAAAWASAGLQLERISVNVSAVQLRDRGFAERVIALCRSHGWPPTRLELELTESALIRDTEALRRCFELFEEHGVQLAVDDFGTGFSNLHYLNRFPVQRLKIDRSFVQDMLQDSGTAKVTQAIVQLGHALGMEVVAEGVETMQEEMLLREQGCDEIQGYLYSRPLPSREMGAFLRAHHDQVSSAFRRPALVAS
ncbi:EAL domain-containing protein [Pseudoxanthomonas sp.]|uniref:bifunctional diguanylate cyclase/phosphodiesterase n=1 Tax=Pseudoxanthomonas sp. TaxID=1871049 RepID=UPI00262ED4ED|nr:EAL domain-containing protein [Pseudoxanthomonas sp.]WDS36863.1 MAG: EAL domain-containing protein [Pseudoxanthomonas sp.]